MIHHSDRGVQYASKQYTDLLLSQGIRISMTQTGDPLHNALAERMNNTLKNGWLFNEGDMDFRQAEEAVKKIRCDVQQFVKDAEGTGNEYHGDFLRQRRKPSYGISV